MIQAGERFQTGNYGPVLVYRMADLTDRYRIVSVLVEQEPHAGLKLGIPEHELGTPKFPRLCRYRDPYCPCQDGDPCHYEPTATTPAWDPPE